MRYLLFGFLLLIGFNILTWNTIAVHLVNADVLILRFLDVGQGDSQLVELPEGGRVLIDGGPDKETSFQLDKVLPRTNRYIDLVVLTHAEKDHLGGLGDVISRHQVGAFLWNGEGAESELWSELTKVLSERNVPTIRLGEGDKITQGQSTIRIVSPDGESLGNSNKNEGSLVMILESQKIKTLYTGDIGIETENKLVNQNDLDADILKVAHHGSRFSTSIGFLEEVSPAIAIIEVGDNNYGHPHPTTLQKLEMTGVSTYRTDINGMVSLLIQNGRIGVQTEK